MVTFKKFMASQLIKKALEAHQRAETKQPCSWQANAETRAQDEEKEVKRTYSEVKNNPYLAERIKRRFEEVKANDEVVNLLLAEPTEQSRLNEEPWLNKRLD